MSLNFIRGVPLWRLFSLIISSSSKAPCQQANCNKQHQNKAGQSDDNDKVDIGKTWKTFKKSKEKDSKSIVMSFAGLPQVMKCSGEKFIPREEK